MKSVSVDELAVVLQEQRGAVVIDVRSGAQFAGGHVCGARNIPLGTIPASAADLGSLPVYLMCASGDRSAKAAQLLHDSGVEAIHVSGGIRAWLAAGHPVARSRSASRLLLPLAACLTLGLAPFVPEPHVVGKIRWAAGGASGMGAMDWFDLVMHGAPWVWLLAAVGSYLATPAD